MPLESATFISQLTPTNPTAGDLKSEGDDHLRLLKSVLQNQFPNLGPNAINATATDLNAVTGAASTGANIKVVTPATSSNDTSAASTAFTQSLVAAAVGSGSPAPAWVSGTTYAVGNVVYSPINFQTYRRRIAGAGTTDPSADSTNWQVLVNTAGTGGTTLTGNVTLTSASPAAMSVTPANPGLYVTLPDATTVSRSTAPFSVYNNGDFDYGVRDSAGTQLGWIRARTGAVIGLADNSTAAGVWAYYGLEKTGITASYVNSTLANMGSTIRRIALDANRTCFLFGGTDCYAIVYDASTQTWGSATLVQNGIASGAFLGVLSATNQVLVCTSTTGTAFTAVTLTVSGTGVTVNTPVGATLAGTFSSFGQLIAVGSSFVVSYGRTALGCLRAITVAGTVPTIGAESAITTTGSSLAPVVFVSGSIVRAVTTSSTVITATPYTVSGSTLALGTAATVTITASTFRAFLNGNGRIVCHYINTTHFATIFSLSGTTETASSVSLGTAPSAITGNGNTYADYLNITASKTLFVSGNNASGSVSANILTDSSGTASAGTEFTSTSLQAMNGVAALFSVGNTGYCSTNQGGARTLAFDCSGASPTLLSIFLPQGSLANNGSIAIASDQFGVRYRTNLVNGTNVTTIGASVQDPQLRYFAGSIRSLSPSYISQGSSGVSGAASNESFFITQLETGIARGVGIQRVESAA